MATLNTGAFVQRLQAQFPDPLKVTPEQVEVVLEQLGEVTEQAKARWISLQASPSQWPANWTTTNIEQFKSELDAWDALYEYYESEGEKAEDNPEEYLKVDEQTGLTLFYRRVVGPLIDGQCYEPPSCSANILAQQTPFAVAPRASVPFVILAAMDETSQAAEDAVLAFFDDVATRVKEVGKAALEAVEYAGENLLKPILIGASIVGGLVLVGWLASDALRPPPETNP